MTGYDASVCSSERTADLRRRKLVVFFAREIDDESLRDALDVRQVVVSIHSSVS